MYLTLDLDEKQLEHIKKEEFYRPADRLDEDVTQLVEWLSKQPHLPKITDRKWLSHFIVGCKYNVQRSKQVIEAYFVAREEHPEFFSSFTRERLVEAIDNGTVTLFPKRTPEGNRIFCTKTNPSTDDDKFDVMTLLQVSLAILDLQLKEEPMYGNVFLYDLQHVRLSQFMAFTPTITKNILKCGINSFPLRVKSVHYVNPPKFVSRLVTFFKMFLPNKLKDRMFVHETLEELYQFIPRDVLPDIYGGTAGKIEQYEDDMLEFLLSNKEWLENRPKADLSRRPEQLKTDGSDSVDGTFKRLQID
ncbi:Cellular retinaldehyde binding/alpha-tocopherol transport,CRAL/TRIO, N-terminal domain,CRAL-TRIO lipid [Cinara cedri]|uniref:Cellular retinaldehyde binding/alpha-tocopherol transport,CRAL/TRIO, N-terminal domain,CRAL-TRIO lipid n=1 Tax=Cinara cedri TaxID=506608 RepID=A0A5E4N7Y5_9HEMI|nr:Cellular retinaldehyde binding/alpha-tocopherol transport,CRAL/TRIO, N-terminal domain,CRAL-TRIO lipid [Cinara cedri]